MPSHEQRIKRLESKAKTLEKLLKKANTNTKKVASDLAKAKKEAAKTKKALGASQKDIKDIIKWIILEVDWSQDVTKTIRKVNWAALVAAYPGGGASGPPQTPPDWPVSAA